MLLFILASAFSLGTVSAYPKLTLVTAGASAPPEQEVRGEARLVGHLGADETSLLQWVVIDDDADHFWDLEVSSVPGTQVTVVLEPLREEPARFGVATFGSFGDGDVAESIADDPLFTLSNTPRRATALMQRQLLPSGEYQLRISAGPEPTEYQVVVSRNSLFALELRQRAAPDAPLAPGTDRYLHIDASEFVLPLDLNEDSAAHFWRLQVTSERGRSLALALENADGEAFAQTTTDSTAGIGRLALDPGTRLRLKGDDAEAIGRVQLRLEEDGSRSLATPGRPASAQWLTLGEPLELHFPFSRNTRVAALRIEDAETPVSLSLNSENEGLELCLVHESRDEPTCQSGTNPAFRDLLLPVGDYRVDIQSVRRNADIQATLTLAEGQRQPDHWVAFPNRTASWAYPLVPGQTVEVRLDQSAEAWFELNVGPDVRQWQFISESDSRIAHHLEVHRPERLAMSSLHFAALFPGEASNRAMAMARNAETLRIDHLRLLPGRYLIRLQGRDANYRLTAIPGDTSAPGLEAEPNDRPRHANPLWLGGPVHGTFHVTHDQDHFQFRVPGWNRVRMTVAAPDDVSMRTRLMWEGHAQGDFAVVTVPPGQQRQEAFWLPAGDRLLWLRGEQAGEGFYRARVELIPPWDLSDGVEPAATPEEAPEVPTRTRIGGLAQVTGTERGFLRLPAGDAPRELRLTGQIVTGDRRPRGGQTWIALRTEAGEDIPITPVPRTRDVLADLPANQRVYLEVAFGPSHSTTVLEDLARPEPAPLGLTLSARSGPLAAHLADGQSVEVELKIENPTSETQTLPIETHLSHGGAYLEGLENALTLQPGAALRRPLVVHAPPGLSADDRVVLFARVGRHDTRLDLPVERDAPPQSPSAGSSDLAEYHGLTDLAWAGVGAAFVDPENGADVGGRWRGRNRELRALIDGLSSASAADWREFGDPLPPLRLAGDGGTLQALVFNQRSGHQPARLWRRIAVAIGDTPTTFTPLMEVELSLEPGEQLFPIDAPRQARYVQLTPLTVWGTHPGAGEITGTGMFRALGEPTGELRERRHDLLAPEHGGHWIYTVPDLRRLHGLMGQRHGMGTTARATHPEARLTGGEPIRGRRIEMVFGFANQRAARIDHLRWQDDLDWNGALVERVRIYTATESPAGPWTEQARWELERDAQGVADLLLNEMPWARYLRLAFDEPPANPEQRIPTWRIPRQLQAFEAAGLGTQDSILGYWGLDHSRGPYEVRARAEVESGTAQALTVIDADALLAEGQMNEPGDRHTVTLHLEEGHNTFELLLEESVRGRLTASLEAEDGSGIELRWQNRPGVRIAEATALAAGTYRLTLAEPPRSIVFIWDGSGSIGTLQPAIYQALLRFAEGLRPGREVFNLMSLGGPLLLGDWAEDPATMAMAVGHYDLRYSGSDSEPALRIASRALESREGERVIFLLTDAELVSRDAAAWEDLLRVQPRIFAINIGHGEQRDPDELRWYQDLMHAWSSLGDGRYFYATGRNNMIRAFEESMRDMRAPSTWRLGVTQRYHAPPEPGQFSVIGGDSPQVGAGAVHLIFDASGSMLRRMEGGRRIEVARRMVQHVLDTHIPEDVPVALRAFGHTAPHSCATELLVGAEAGSHGQVRDAVARIQAINLARTPLADSLLAVPDDLAAFSGQARLVVMITDGEETCDGDVEQAVRTLVESGIEMRLNIVGFHIDEISLQNEFARLATLAGGEYFDSRDEEQLLQGLSAALAPRWRLVNAQHEIAATGRVGDPPVKLDAGDYTLHTEHRDGETEHPVRIAPNETVVHRLP